MTKQIQIAFPQLVEAVKAHEELAANTDMGLWHIGAALIVECGAPGERGVNTGAHDKLQKAAKALEQEKFHGYTVRYLKMLRTVAANFPEGTRVPSVGWAIHSKAGTPMKLRQIMQHTQNRGKRLTVRYAEKFLADEKARREQAQQGKNGKGNGKTDAARDAATQKLVENVAQVRELRKDTTRAFKSYPKLTPEEVTAVKGLLEDWNQFLRTHGAGADQLLEAAE